MTLLIWAAVGWLLGWFTSQFLEDRPWVHLTSDSVLGIMGAIGGGLIVMRYFPGEWNAFITAVLGSALLLTIGHLWKIKKV